MDLDLLLKQLTRSTKPQSDSSLRATRLLFFCVCILLSSLSSHAYAQSSSSENAVSKRPIAEEQAADQSESTSSQVKAQEISDSKISEPQTDEAELAGSEIESDASTRTSAEKTNEQKEEKQEITIHGIDDLETLQAYISKTVVEKYLKKEERFLAAQVKSDLEKALRASGYYASKTTYELQAAMAFDIKTGPLYTISKINLQGFDEIPVESLTVSSPLVAEDVLAAQQTLYAKVNKQECFYNLSVKNEVILDNALHTGEISFIVSGENGAKFGASEFTGSEKITQQYLNTFINYEEGACWNPLDIENTKAGIIGTGLVVRANAILPKHLPADKIVPIKYELTEAPMRNIKLGAYFNNNDGPGVSAEWKHKNVFGGAEEVKVYTDISGVQQTVGVGYSEPHFLSEKQSFEASAEFKNEETDAYDSVSLDLNAGINRTLSDNWSGQIGVSLETSRITDKEDDGDEETTFALVSLPMSLSYDSRDDVLDPHKGHTLFISAEPFADVLGEADPFFKTRITGTTYFHFDKAEKDTVLAMRGSIGSILGSSTEEIPANKRFYAGGGGSIRGFGYQEAGPVDDSDDPEGGRSLIESSVELRRKFTDSIGGVAFIDAGGVYDSVVPDFKEGMYVGAGVGARYYTSFGPIRFDLAVPVNEQGKTDQGFQVYISIGQAY